ncbi:MAG: hypothetical protein L6420_10655 [Elusimicrobia bacterium]|nr:hypothetical protein [Elusimicrobiota bacterium]
MRKTIKRPKCVALSNCGLRLRLRFRNKKIAPLYGFSFLISVVLNLNPSLNPPYQNITDNLGGGAYGASRNSSVNDCLAMNYENDRHYYRLCFDIGQVDLSFKTLAIAECLF